MKTAEKHFLKATDSVVAALRTIETKADELMDKRTAIDTAISLGYVLSSCDLNEDALTEYDKAIYIESKNFRAWDSKGDTLMKMAR